MSHQDRCCPIQQGSIGNIGVASDPANVCSAEVDISRVVVKGILESGGSVEHVAPNGV